MSTLIVGFDPYTCALYLYKIDPSFTFLTWKEKGKERNSNFIRAPLGVVESKGNNIRIVLMTCDNGLQQLEEFEVEAIIVEVEAIAKTTKKRLPFIDIKSKCFVDGFMDILCY